jgi:hypothetical protein
MEPQWNQPQGQTNIYQPPVVPTVPLIDAHETDGIPATPTFAAPAPQVVTSSWDPQPAAPTVNPSWQTPTPSYEPVQPSYTESVPTPPAPAAVPSLNTQDPLRPVAVVRVLSPVGVEYVFLTFTLFTGAFGLASAFLSLVNGKADFSVLAFPTATLLVSVPIFAYLFLRLKKMELYQPDLKLDPSKRRSTQFTQIFSFIICLFTLIGLVFAILSSIGGQSAVSVGKAFLDALSLLVVFGGVLAYYWRDEHKGR